MAGVNTFIDGYELESAFGVCLEEGGLNVFEKPPKPKEPFFNDWNDQNGREYDDVSPLKYESRTFDVPFLIIGSSMVDYRKKKKDFLDLIMKNGEFDLQIMEWGEAFKVRFKEFVSWDLLNSGINSETSARFVVRLEDNYGRPMAFRFLVSEQGKYIISNNKRILVKTLY